MADQRKIAQALTEAAALRGGQLDKETKRLYLEKLCRHPVEDVLTALEKLGDLERGDYEAAVPDCPGLVALVRSVTVARQNRLEAEKRKRLVIWLCPDCHVSCAGWVIPGGFLARRCQGIPRDGSIRSGRICGAALEVAYDEALEPDEN